MKTFFRILFFFLLVTQICFAQWYQQTSGTTANLNAVQFIDINNGWAVGDSGIILHTTNGGQEWLTQISGTSLSLFDVCFIDSNNGWIVGGSEYWMYWQHVILKTTNGGETWVEQLFGEIYWLRGVSFININNGTVVGGKWNGNYYEGVIFRTTNGGIDWIQQTNSSEFSLNDVFMIDADNVVAVGGAVSEMYGIGLFLKTSNGGSNWTCYTISEYVLTSISFIDNYIGYIVGHGYQGSKKNDTEVTKGNFPVSDPLFLALIKTTDGGLNWIAQFSPSPQLNSVYFTDENNGTVVGFQTNFTVPIYRTTNGGIDWTSQGSGTIPEFRSVFFIDALNGCATGINGTILHTTNGGVTFIEEDEPSPLPTEYSLLQNYPNPFNSSSVIKYSIPKSSQVTLKIFSTLGEEIEILANEEKPAGTYEVAWYAEQLPSGVYFYRLQAGDLVQTRKMILLK